MTTDEWIARIEAVRRIDGFNGPTWSSQPILARFVVEADRTDCAVCHRVLTKEQRWWRSTYCSTRCQADALVGVAWGTPFHCEGAA